MGLQCLGAMKAIQECLIMHMFMFNVQPIEISFPFQPTFLQFQFYFHFINPVASSVLMY